MVYGGQRGADVTQGRQAEGRASGQYRAALWSAVGQEPWPIVVIRAKTTAASPSSGRLKYSTGIGKRFCL
jgi:hypothetical protein